MDTLKQLRDELAQEYETTKAFFEIYPDDKNDYKPHEKSMPMIHLATHIAEIFGWAGFMLQSSDLDLSDGSMKPKILSTRQEILDVFKENFKKSIKALEDATEEDLLPEWALKMNGHVLAKWTKYGAIRHSLDQITHHRAQLGVYYRLNEMKLPGSYGPTADVQGF